MKEWALTLFIVCASFLFGIGVGHVSASKQQAGSINPAALQVHTYDVGDEKCHVLMGDNQILKMVCQFTGDE
jgi:hypothetical protein